MQCRENFVAYAVADVHKTRGLADSLPTCEIKTNIWKNLKSVWRPEGGSSFDNLTVDGKE